MVITQSKFPIARRLSELASCAVLLAAVGLASTQPLSAQDVSPLASGIRTPDRNLEAEDGQQQIRDRQAEDLIETAQTVQATRRWTEAASLYEEAAALRARSDPRAIDELEQAANLHAFGDNHSMAVELLEKAAERAVEMDDIFRGALSFRQAAVLNSRNGGVRLRTTSLWERVCDLSKSDQLTDDQRRRLLGSVPICR